MYRSKNQRRPDESYPGWIERMVRAWPQWSRAERRRMDEIVEEVIDHCANGTGNAFVRSWCERVLRA